jgi:16S rRNA processing protein RimM
LSSSTDDRITVGRIGRPHGVRGQVTIVLEPGDRSYFDPGSVVWADEDRCLTVVSVSSYRDRGLVVGFEGVTDRDDAEGLRGSNVSVPAGARRNLDEGEFWLDDLVGLEAVDPEGVVLGVVSSIDFGEAQDRIVVATPDGRQVLVPFVSALVGDPVDGRLEIRDPGGLFA